MSYEQNHYIRINENGDWSYCDMPTAPDQDCYIQYDIHKYLYDRQRAVIEDLQIENSNLQSQIYLLSQRLLNAENELANSKNRKI